ncbi:MAG TPA: DNA primase [Gammaproteobacteria bacterium]|nr:DNA primase [Gammaproteobacteria bacterium]
MIPQEFIDELLARTDIVQIIEPRVALKKRGKDYQGLCPFHNEKSPSFTVSQDKGFYHCFGCQAHGSALHFLQEYERMDFVSAVEMLAARVGMEVPRQNDGLPKEVHRERRTIYEILERSSDFYKDQLRNYPSRARAVDYLKSRGLSGEIARDFCLGYAPAEWDSLQTAMATSNYDRELLIKSGMLIENTDEDRSYDRFRDRVMFPIRDLRGKTIAFGGRIIGDGKPKYLNSPETPVFHKGRELYGLYEARRRTARLEQVIVVEGYMDVVALAQHGIDYSVATLGTATTSDHIERLYRLVSKIIFCFDGDDAGRKAAWKALDTVLGFLQDGRSAVFLFLPDGEDPDSLIRKDGKERFEERLQEATSFTDFFYSHLEIGLDMSTPEGKAALSKLAVPLIHRIPEGVFKQLVIDGLSERVGLDVEKLMSASKGYQQEKRAYVDDAPTSSYATEPKAMVPHRDDLDSQVDQAISMLLIQPELIDLFEPQDYAHLASDPTTHLLVKLVEYVSGQDNPEPAKILSHFNGTPDFERIQRLSNREQLLDVSQFADEFQGILKKQLTRMEAESKKRGIEELLRKPMSALSEEEREIIRNHHQKKQQGAS